MPGSIKPMPYASGLVLGLVSGLVLGLVVLSGTPSEAAGGSDPDLVARGGKLAQLVCSVCHVVAQDDKHVPMLREPGPSFVAIAVRPSTTEATLRTFMETKHSDIGPSAQMPNPRLVDYEIDELVAYILSLRK